MISDVPFSTLDACECRLVSPNCFGKELEGLAASSSCLEAAGTSFRAASAVPPSVFCKRKAFRALISRIRHCNVSPTDGMICGSCLHASIIR